MAVSDTAAAAAPPLFPTPTKASSPDLLPASPSTIRPAPFHFPSLSSRRRDTPSPASPAPSPSKKSGRASSSDNWVCDKELRTGVVPPPSALLPTPPSTVRPTPFHFPSLSSRRHNPSPTSPAPSPSKKPGRASSSDSWVVDKEVRAGVVPPPSAERTNGAKIPGGASLLPIPPNSSLPALLPTPTSTIRPTPFHFPSLSSRRHTPSPASPAPSPSKKPGCASSSDSWVAGVAPPPSAERTNGAKIPGRASLLPIPHNSSLPALLPTPISTVRPAPFHFPSLSSRRHTPASSPSKNPGHASARESWVRDKEAGANLAPRPLMGRANGGKIAGRASLSEDWVIDKIVAGSGCSKRSMTPLSDSCAGKKKPRYDSLTPLAEDSSDSKQEFYARPAFLNAPPASALPMPCFPPRKRSPNPVPALLAC